MEDKELEQPVETKPKKRNIVSRIFLCLVDVLVAFLDGTYKVVKKVMKFWWVALIILILFYPKPLLEFLKGFVGTIENIKNLIGG